MKLFSQSLSPKRWHPLWKSVPAIVFGLLLFGYQATSEHDVASEQRSGFAIVTDCGQRGRDYATYCHYVFSVGEKQYTGLGQASREAAFGDTVVVYYDSEDPNTSALESYSVQSRTHRRYCFVLAVILAAVLGIIGLNRVMLQEH